MISNENRNEISCVAPANLAQRWTRFRTLKELSALSDHELADIGIHRANIGDVARGFASRA